MGSLRVLILPFSSFCYAYRKVKEAEMAAPCLHLLMAMGIQEKMHLNYPVRLPGPSFCPGGCLKPCLFEKEYGNFPASSNHLYYYLVVMY